MITKLEANQKNYLPMGKGGRPFSSLKAQAIGRLNLIYELFCEGYTSMQIFKKINSVGEIMKLNAVQRYVRFIKNQIANSFMESSEFRRKNYLSKFFYLYKKNIEKEDYGEARKVLESAAGIEGLANISEPSKIIVPIVIHNSSGALIDTLSTSELAVIDDKPKTNLGKE